MALAGFPVVNFAASLRNTISAPGTQARVAMAIPRPKYTFLIEMTLNPNASLSLSALTNVFTFVDNGKIYGQLKSIDYPRPRFDVETLRSYNRWRKVVRKMSYEPATIVWTDDSTAMVQSLVKEYINFYHETGNIGSTNIASDDRQINTDTGIVGPGVRDGMGIRPSLGMRLRAPYIRHFFESITIYDLGTEPTSINVHTFNTPVFLGFDHDDLDWYDGFGMVNQRWQFEYESYFFTTAENVDQFSDVLDKILGGDSNTTA
jgi:hypothetical protein